MSFTEHETLALPVRESDHILGPAQAPVTIVEYGDYQCPFCAAAAPAVQSLRVELGDRVRFVFRHFPVPTVHPLAREAAEAAEAAADQGRFWEMHEQLFKSQDRFEPDIFPELALNLNLDLENFQRAIQNHTHRDRVQEDVLSGIHSGVAGTPTFFFNGVRHEGAQTFDALLEAAQQAERHQALRERDAPAAITHVSTEPDAETWPDLPLEAWTETCDALHLWMQVVGKVKLALLPFLNELWQVGFHLTPRGVTTMTIPYPQGTFAIDFDFIESSLRIDTSAGHRAVLPLRSQSVATFYRDCMAALKSVGIDVHISTMPAEIPNPIAFDEDRVDRPYDAEAVRRYWSILLQIERVFQRFRARFGGKSSPILLWWGSFDLGTTRFSGLPAPPLTGVPRFFALAEDQENFACGFWPGNENMLGVAVGKPCFYAYIYPAPDGFKDARISPAGAYFDETLGELILPYDVVRAAASPDDALLEFLQSSYEAAASLAGWDRQLLDIHYPEAQAR